MNYNEKLNVIEEKYDLMTKLHVTYGISLKDQYLIKKYLKKIVCKMVERYRHVIILGENNDIDYWQKLNKKWGFADRVELVAFNDLFSIKLNDDLEKKNRIYSKLKLLKGRAGKLYILIALVEWANIFGEL